MEVSKLILPLEVSASSHGRPAVPHEYIGNHRIGIPWIILFIFQILYQRVTESLLLYAVGIVLTINANLGLAPWDVFHQGMTHIIDITMGQASIAVGIILVILNAVLGERLGWGTLFNMLFIGLFMDLIMLDHLIPTCKGVISGAIMMVLGMIFIGIASYFYIGAGLGAGPRDGLMIALTKKTSKSVRFVRNAIELSALIVGYMLGGYAGVGTLIMALALGYIMQFLFKAFKI